MVDYFSDVSHGKLDLSGSKVFGWLTLDQKKSDYIGSGANPTGRQQLIDWARAKAKDAGHPIDNFYSVVVCLNDDLDLFGGRSGVVCGDPGDKLALYGLAPGLVAQEMGHAYGMAHSYADGATAPYTDPYDVMSTPTQFMAPHPFYPERTPTGGSVFAIGPGVNAANMCGRGWLDMSRVWESPSGNVGAKLELRPLYRKDLPGHLALKFGEFFVELRGGSGWDAGFSPSVFIHYLEENVSYLVSDDAGRQAWQAGSKLSLDPTLSLLGSSWSISVESIEPTGESASIIVQRTAPVLPQEWPKSGPFNTPWIKWANLESGRVHGVIVDGRVVELPKSSAMNAVLRHIALLSQVDSMPVSPMLADTIRLEALESIAGLTSDSLGKVRGPRTPGRGPIG